MPRYGCGVHLIHALEALPTIRTSGADVLEELKIESDEFEVWISHQSPGKEILVLGKDRPDYPPNTDVLETYEID